MEHQSILNVSKRNSVRLTPTNNFKLLEVLDASKQVLNLLPENYKVLLRNKIEIDPLKAWIDLPLNLKSDIRKKITFDSNNNYISELFKLKTIETYLNPSPELIESINCETMIRYQNKILYNNTITLKRIDNLYMPAYQVKSITRLIRRLGINYKFSIDYRIEPGKRFDNHAHIPINIFGTIRIIEILVFHPITLKEFLVDIQEWLIDPFVIAALT